MPGLIRGVARTAVVAGTATAVSNRVSRRQAGRWAAQGYYDQPQYSQPQYEQPQYAQPRYEAAPPADDMSSKLAQLKELGELKAQGVLSESEFQRQKALVLGS
jgi:Short C-terminal domain